MPKTCKKLENKDKCEDSSYEFISEYLKTYDRFICKVALSVKGKCQRLEFEDIKQQLILTLLLNYKKFDSRKCIKTSSYLSQIVVNAANNIVRKYWQDKNKANINCLSLDAYVNDGSSNFQYMSLLKEEDESFLYPTNIYIKNELEEKLNEAKKTLSSFEKKVFTLYLNGNSIDQIAIKIKKSKKQVYNALSIARDKIKSKL